MTLIQEDDTLRSLVRLVIEKNLLEIGKPILDKTIDYLKKEHNCQIEDCYEHPEYLNAALEELFGKAGISISESIRNQLEEYNYDNKIALLMKTLTK